MFDWKTHLQKYESQARTYSRAFPTLFTEAKGIYLKDAEGKKYIDCVSCAGALAIGHNHDFVQKSIFEYVASNKPLQSLDLVTEAKINFVKKLFQILPEEMRNNYKIHFCSPSGADAVEAAIKLSKIATRRGSVWSFTGGWHGQTSGSLALMGDLNPKSLLHDQSGNAHFFPFPFKYHCPLEKRDCADCACDQPVKNALNDPHSGLKLPAAVITELVQGEGGVVSANLNWVDSIRSLTKLKDIPLIFDEVQTGLGRTGTMFAFEKFKVSPDILVLSKAIGGGLPLACIVYHESLDVWPTGAHTGTFRGNQLAFVTGEATIDFILQNRLHERSLEMGFLFLERLNSLQQKYSVIGDVRVYGLMIGIEIISPNLKKDGSFSFTDKELTKKIQENLFLDGLLVETVGRNSSVIKLLPPLTVTSEEVHVICTKLDQAINLATKAAAF